MDFGISLQFGVISRAFIRRFRTSAEGGCGSWSCMGTRRKAAQSIPVRQDLVDGVNRRADRDVRTFSVVGVPTAISMEPYRAQARRSASADVGDWRISDHPRRLIYGGGTCFAAPDCFLEDSAIWFLDAELP